MAQPPRTSPIDALADLARQAASGDDAAFEAIYRRLHGGLLRFLTGRGVSDELAEELAQRTWVEVWRALQAGRYDPSRSAMSTFCYAVGYKLWLQERRRSAAASRAGLEGEDLLASLAGNSDDPATALSLAEVMDAMKDCLHRQGTPNSLSPEELAIVTGIAGGETDRSMAATVGCSPSTLNVRKNAAYEKLRRCLRAKGCLPPERET